MDSFIKNNVIAFFEDITKQDVAVAFSGGADSALILKLACDGARKNGTNVYAVTVETKLHPHEDVAVAARVASEIGAIHKVVCIDEFADERMMHNPKDRCYICKHMIFSELLSLAKSLGIETVLEGTNEDDLHVYRPGIKALKELGIVSPLAKFGVTKAMVREWLEELGISVAKRPSAPCLATRIPYGTLLEEKVLKQIDEGETYLKELGFVNVRIRVHGQIARIEIDINQMMNLIEKREEIISHLKEIGFLYLTLDMEGFRSGSMDIEIDEKVMEEN